MRGVTVQYRHPVHRHRDIDVGIQDLVQLGADLLFLAADPRDYVARDLDGIEPAESRAESACSVTTVADSIPNALSIGASAMASATTTQFGFATSAPPDSDQGWVAMPAIAVAFTSGMTSGVSGRSRCADALVQTTWPARARAGSVSFAGPDGRAEKRHAAPQGGSRREQREPGRPWRRIAADRPPGRFDVVAARPPL